MTTLFEKPNKPPKPPRTPTEANANTKLAGADADMGFQSLISTSPSGLTGKPQTGKRTLVGGAS